MYTRTSSSARIALLVHSVALVVLIGGCSPSPAGTPRQSGQSATADVSLAGPPVLPPPPPTAPASSQPEVLLVPRSGGGFDAVHYPFSSPVPRRVLPAGPEGKIAVQGPDGQWSSLPATPEATFSKLPHALVARPGGTVVAVSMTPSQPMEPPPPPPPAGLPPRSFGPALSRSEVLLIPLSGGGFDAVPYSFSAPVPKLVLPPGPDGWIAVQTAEGQWNYIPYAPVGHFSQLPHALITRPDGTLIAVPEELPPPLPPSPPRDTTDTGPALASVTSDSVEPRVRLVDGR